MNDERPLTISVQGEHTIRIAPERAELTASVSVESGTAGEAVRRASALVTELREELDRLKASGAVDRLVVNPLGTRSWRPYSDKGARLPLRYAATCRIVAEFVDLKALGAFGATAGGRDGVSLGQVAWTLTDATRTRTEAEALTAAVGRSRERALAVARAAGFEDVIATQFADPGLLAATPAPAPGMMLRSAKAYGAAEEGFEVVPEDIEVSVAIQGRFTAH